MNFTIYIIPFISAAIGWVTNYVAIKMLFRPRKAVYVLGYPVQGIFPKRKPTLAKRLGGIVARDLFSPEMIADKLDTPENRASLKKSILERIMEYIDEMVTQNGGGALLMMFGGDKIKDQIHERLETMLDEMIPQMMNSVTQKVEEVDIEDMVEKRVLDFSDQKLEDLLMSVIKKELKFIELMGAILGFIIGFVQIGIVALTA
ncbi:DUF445 domain-containing protein [Sediminitomix flava]|uniref:Uncharacterized protein DUF445 n=1 Tax=Sediminitomix flava TaxID=379075 RepID=A0A315ZYQ1_SEDFL|nr:DUF445 family protein [Sediminitomix flava]PWJ42497.1 uncharacterized protein DUF445 [Sediminitomix flava]